MILIYLVIGVISFIVYVKWWQTYWKRKGMPSNNPDFFFGDLKNTILRNEPVWTQARKRYDQFKKLGYKHVGFYNFWQPIYFPIDPAIIKNIMQQDAQYFQAHGTFHHPDDILTMHLFSLENERWRELRAKLTPAFTSGKIKMMFETVVEKSDPLKNVVSKLADQKEGFVIKDVCGNYTTDVIASCGFGIECDSLNEPDNAFRMYGRQLFVPKPIRFIMLNVFNWNLLIKLGFKTSNSEMSKFFINLVKNTIKNREDNEIFRKDFMHLLLQLKNQGIISNNTNVNSTTTSEKGILSENDIIAQCFIFFIAGFETSSSIMTFAMLELAQNQDIQEKLRKEILEVLAKHDGKITYEAVMDMPYLDKVTDETLRKYPPLAVIPRKCTKNYKIPGTDIVLEKDTAVNIPVWAIQNDPEYYPNPEVFDPERFTEENKVNRPEFTYFPFGAGPRTCIGLRFGKVQTKVGLITLLKNFKFTLNEKTPLPIEMERGFILSVKGNVWVNATKI